MDDLPAGLEFVKDNETNKKFGWKLIDKTGKETTDLNQAKSVRTDYLSRAKSVDNVIKAFGDESVAELENVGRLDYNTSGLLILTNDGETAHKLLSPKYNKEKVYKVTAEKPFTKDDIEKLKVGVMLDDGMTKPVGLSMTSNPNIAHMTLTEGRFRRGDIDIGT